MGGTRLFSIEFNINGKVIYGSIKQNKEDTFVEIKYDNEVKQKIYNGSIDNQDQMISEIESLIEESCDIE